DDGILLRADRYDRLRQVLTLPAARQRDLEAEIGMIERVALEEPVARIGAVDEAIDPLQVLRAVHLRVRELRRLKLRELGVDRLNAFRFAGVGREPRWQRTLLARLAESLE